MSSFFYMLRSIEIIASLAIPILLIVTVLGFFLFLVLRDAFNYCKRRLKRRKRNEKRNNKNIDKGV